MSASPLEDAFAHHVWASLQVIDACAGLSPEQLETSVPGTYGSILATVRHLVGADSWYLFDLTRDAERRIDAHSMGLSELRAAVEADGSAWSRFLDASPDPDEIVKEIDEDDGFERDAPIGVRLAQALHHGTDHRSQICTALTSIGLEPPGIDVWNYGVAAGRSVETWPAS